METTKNDPRGPFVGVRDGARRVTDIVGASFDLVQNVLRNVDRMVSDVRRDSMAVAHTSRDMYAAASDQVGAVREAIRATPRFTRIVTQGVRVLASYKIYQAKKPALSAEAAEAALLAVHEASAKRLYDLCVEMRGGVLKLGQLVSCRMDLLPEPYVTHLSKLQDRVPALPSAAMIARIEHELGGSIDELFASFDPEPIAAASLAQVHAAVLADGTEVAVKVQIPGIEDIVDIDLTALRVLSNLLGELLPKVDMTTIVNECRRSLIAELDYVAEAANIAEFAGHFTSDDSVVTVRVYPELSSGRVLTMQRIHGARLVDFLDECERAGDGDARDRVFTTLIDAFCAQVLSTGLLHSDPHPGNFLVCDGGASVAFLDFGSVARFSASERAGYATLAGAILAQDSNKVASELITMGFGTEDGKLDGLVEFADMFLQVFREGAAGDLSKIDPKAELDRALELARNNPVVRIPQSFVMLGRVFGAMGGLVFRYRPDIELFSIIAPHLSRALGLARRMETSAAALSR